MAKAETPARAATFTKEQLRASKKFAERKDAIMALLDDKKTYTIVEAETIINNYMKGEVK